MRWHGCAAWMGAAEASIVTLRASIRRIEAPFMERIDENVSPRAMDLLVSF